MLPRWTGRLAIVAAVLNLTATLTVFVPDGTASIRDSLVVWLPGLSVVVWYLSVALALLRVSRRQAVSNEGRSSST